MDYASLIAFASITGGISIGVLLYAIFAPATKKTENTHSEIVLDVFGEDLLSGAANDDLMGRYAKPIANNLLPGLPQNFLPQGILTSYEKLLRVSGNPLRLVPQELVALQIAGGLIGLIGGLFLTLLVAVPNVPPILIPALFAFAGGVLPYTYHSSLKEKRNKDVQMNLPEALDLLQVIMATGTAFQNSLKKAVAQLPNSFLKSELTAIYVNLQASIPLENCMERFAASNTNESAQAFASAVIQSERLGSDLGETLVKQAEMIRDNHMAMLDKLISKLNTTLLTPPTLLMLPAFMLIFLGPGLNNVMNVLGG